MLLNITVISIKAMTSEAPGPSRQRIQQEPDAVVSGDGLSAGNHAHNISVQTGEEFSLEFLQDRVAPRRVPIITDMNQGHMKRVGFNLNRNHRLGYEDLTGILGLGRMDSVCDSDISDSAYGKGCVMEVDKKTYSDKVSRYKETSVSGQESRKSSDEMNCDQASLGMAPSPIDMFGSPHAFHLNGSGASNGSLSGKMKFLCSFGGRILPRPNDGKLRYVGGETRIISIKKTVSWGELVKKTSAICNQPHTIKYQLPGEDLDALISVSSDEDLQNMIEEYDGLERVEGSQRMRIFLISSCESESPCSFEARATQQGNSDYHYVVAVNGIMDPSPRKSSSGQSLASQLGNNLDCSPSFRRDSPTLLHPLEIKDRISSSNLLGMFSHPSAQFLIAPQNLTKSPNQSPPFSPLPIQHRDPKTSHVQFYEDHSCPGNNENSSPFVMDQQPSDNSNCIDTTGYYHFPHGPGQLMNYHYPSKHVVDIDQPNRHHGVHFHHHRPNRDFVASPIFGQNGSDFEGCSGERLMLKERAFHSEKALSHMEDTVGLLSGSNDSVGSHHGMPHALSDSQLQELGGRSIYWLQDKITQSPPLNFATTQSPSLVMSSALHQWPMQQQGSTEFTNPHFEYKLLDVESTGSQTRLDLPNCSLRPGSSDRNELIHQDTQNNDDEYQTAKEDVNEPKFMARDSHEENPGVSRDMLNWMDEKYYLLHHGGKDHESDMNNGSLANAVEYKNKLPNINHYPTSMLGVHISPHELQAPEGMVLASSAYTLKPCAIIEKPQGYQLDKTASELHVKSQKTAKVQQYALTETMNNETESKASNAFPCTSLVSLSRDSEVADFEKIHHHNTKQQSPDENSPTYMLRGSSSGLVSHGFPMSQKEMDDQEPIVISSINLPPLTFEDDAGLSFNLHKNEPPLTWSSFWNPVTDAAFGREVSPIDEEPVSFPEQKFEKLGPGGNSYERLKVEDAILGHPEHLNNFDEQNQLESVVIIEDVTDRMPLGIHCSPTIVPYVLDEVCSEIQSPRVTEAESITPESESEDAKADDRDMDESISDSTIAEIEAGIYGLQEYLSSHLANLMLYMMLHECRAKAGITTAQLLKIEIHPNVLLNADIQIIKNADLEELRELGSGTFGTVYHGKWRGTDVAIKRIKKSCFAGRSSEQERLTKDFWREAQILSKLHHPNVVAFYGVVPDGDGGTLATVTEFMVNGSLRHVLLRKDRALDRRKRLIIAMDAAFGMEYLHLKNIVHFDLKCDNLLVNMRDPQRPICKVGDFGLSRIKRNTLVSGGVRGTLPWMAPELLNGSSSRVSEKVDVFSFGIAMWEILTGEDPYANMHTGAIIGGIVSNTLRPPIPDRCDPEWRKLMEQCWSPDPAVRPSFTEITNRLRVMSIALQAKGHNQTKQLKSNISM
ncbi:hypothetical protein HHK36_027021 [Tetracentron sinense]|uniref:Protein kinase domain-containing protein n=1 Tax=Tetracentron sinense TaxID=13715 RepID=A0A834YHV4_TETSI|nr:hypothetical protein HHK36_027021 [Tetracentron sinense]